GAAIEQPGASGVPGGEVAERSGAFVLMLEALSALDAGRGGQRGVLARAGLDRGLLVTADDVVARVQQLAFPMPAVEIKDPPGLGGELRVTGEDPRAMLPGLDRVLRQPAPDRHPGDLLTD